MNIHLLVFCDLLKIYHLKRFLSKKVPMDTFLELLLKYYLNHHILRNQFLIGYVLNYFVYSCEALEYIKTIELNKQSINTQLKFYIDK